jgi:rsbT co-antagonist protein RsbR
MGRLTLVQTILETQEEQILAEWLRLLRQAGGSGSNFNDGELHAQTSEFLNALQRGISAGGEDIGSPEFIRVRELLAELAASRVAQGFSPGDTALFIFSVKQPVLEALRALPDQNPQALMDATWALTLLIDQLGIFSFELFQKAREEVILRQQREIAEMSTPVVKLWDRILALPLIGTLDSERTQVVMENLLQSIVDEEADIAIIDITGVPTVDTLVAQHLLKTVAAARLMGADCVISGIRPQIAQTMVHLGVELNVVSKATLADAFAVALARTGKSVSSQKKA